MIEHQNLLHPELLTSIPLTGDKIAERLNDLAGKTASVCSVGLPGISVVIRTLNEEGPLEQLLEDVSQQRYSSEPEIIVLDNESTDRTAAVARSFGARVVSYPRDTFTYALSLNKAMRMASNPVVYTTVGHALMSNRQALVASGSRLSQSDVAGVFGRTLPGSNASIPERTVAIGNIAYMKSAQRTKPSKLSTMNLGLFAAQNIALRRDAWEDLGGFDERFESGGEDTDFAIRAIESGMDIVEDQVVAVHHTHGLSLGNYTKQWIHWAKTLKGPQRLDFEELANRRPDIDFSK